MSIVLVGVGLDSVNSFGSIKLCGILCFDLIVDGYGLFVFESLVVFVGELEIYVFFLLFGLHALGFSIILSEGVILVLVSVF